MKREPSWGGGTNFSSQVKWSQSQSYITTVSQPASQSVSQSVGRPWCQAPIWDPQPIFPLPSLIIFRQLQFSAMGHPLRQEVGSVVFCFCWASPAEPFSDLSLMGLTSIFYCLYFWDSPNMEGQGPVFISPKNRVAQLYPQALGLSN
jgi:hypothetical protein